MIVQRARPTCTHATAPAPAPAAPATGSEPEDRGDGDEGASAVAVAVGLVAAPEVGGDAAGRDELLDRVGLGVFARVPRAGRGSAPR